MNISCANCGSSYTLTLDQIAQVPNSVIICKKCERNIKIAQCPSCRVYYSITYSSVKYIAYRLTCEKCKSQFVLTFNEHLIANVNSVARGPRNAEFSKNDNIDRISNRKTHSNRNKQSDGFTIRHLQETVRLAFLQKNILISFIGLSVIILMSVLQYLLVSAKILAIENIYFVGIIKIAHGIPIAITLYLLMMISAIIAWNYKNYTEEFIFSKKELLEIVFRITPLLLICNFMVLILVNSLLISFVKIPTVGPLIFALLFLPIYLLSIATILLALIGFWFVPAIAVNGDHKFKNSISRVLRFLIKQKYSLIIVLPLLFFVLSLFFMIVYSLHIGAYTVVRYIGKIYAADEFLQSFSSVPMVFIRLTEFVFVFSDGSVNRFEKVQSSFTDISGVILGVILVIVAMILYSILLSFASVLAVRTYMLLENEEDISDVRKIRLLTILFIILCLIIIFKKFIIW